MTSNAEDRQVGCIKKMSANIKSVLVFFVNGHKVEDDNPAPEMTLLTYLRSKLLLCGTKFACGEGGCGACTVMISMVDPNNPDGPVRHLSINACLMPVCAVHGMAVTTVEGIGSTRTKLHVVQERIASSHGSQCGFCTPGIVMSMYTLLRNKPKPSFQDMETYFQGNLCRCTGYRPILEGFKTLVEDDVWAKTSSSKSDGCCGRAINGVCCQDGFSQENHNGLFDKNQFRPYDPSQEPIFPPELILGHSFFASQSLVFQSDRMLWVRPNSLEDLLNLKQTYPDAKIVVGNTELGVEVKFKKCFYPVMIQPTKIPEMTSLSTDEKGVLIGSAVTISEMETFFNKLILQEPTWKTRIFIEIVEMLRWFAGKQIRNAASLGGNIMTGSPISDLNPIFMAAGCHLEVGERDTKGNIKKIVIPFDETFFTGYRRNVVTANQVLLSLHVPFTKEDEFMASFKQSRRREDDIAIVNAAFFFRLTREEKTIILTRIAIGGMAPTTKMAPKTSQFMEGKSWNNETLEQATQILLQEFTLLPNVPGGMIRYRQALTASMLFKAYLRITKESGFDEVPDSELSATKLHHRDAIKNHQIWSILPEGKSDIDPVGRPLPHKSAYLHATGEAVYVDDIPRKENEVNLAFVLSSMAHAKILKVDPTEALKVSGVLDFISYKDISKDKNHFHEDEILFAEDEVFCVGQVICAVLATTQDVARRAAQKVVVEYEELPALITIEDAIKKQSFYDIRPGHQINRGNPVNIIQTEDGIDGVIEGSVQIGGQEHFYLETQTSVAVPLNENGEMEIFSSTQNPTDTQTMVAHSLGVPMNRIVIRVKRIGGGFGGKETRSIPICVAAAVAANKVGRPVRVMLDRDEDMLMTGQRNPFMGKYKVGFTKDGIVKAVDVDLYCNAGYTLDLSQGVTQFAMFNSDNAYYIEHLTTRGHCCKTNLQSNTAFRGFGGPQGMMVVEHLIEEVADQLGLDPSEVRDKNLYQEGHKTHYNMILKNCTLRRCWNEVKIQSNYKVELEKVEKFNSLNRWKKQGISIIPTKMGLSYPPKHLNQAGALIQIYHDGSVLVTHGGVEMGQGLHTKMIQVASKTLGIAHDKIHLSETATDKVPNTTPSSASVTSDLNGMAVHNACLKINARLEPIKSQDPNGTWEQWVHKAYLERISLSATGYYATPHLNYSFETNSGNPFSYFTYGAACSVVEIDCLTGDHTVLKTDIVMDVGESLNPAIDIGQIEGAFMQGYGLFTMEQLVHSPDGELLTRGPGAYKIPSFGDIPNEFNVSLLRGSSNPRAVFSSKGIGEPPLFLASSVYFAIVRAIKAARKEVGLEKVPFHVDSPLTSERIRMACEDHLTQQVPNMPEEGSYKPWGIQV